MSSSPTGINYPNRQAEVLAMDNVDLLRAMSLAIAAMFAGPAVKLLFLARSKGKLPHWALAVAFTGLVFAVPLRTFGAVGGLGLTPSKAMTVMGFFFGTVAVGALYLFIWRTFRHGVRWAGWLGRLGVAGAVASFLGALVSYSLDRGVVVVREIVPALAFVPIVWLFCESTTAYRRMRRKVRLGLGDRVVTNRFLLWTIWSGSLVAAPILGVVLRDAVDEVTGLAPHGAASLRLLVVMLLTASVVSASALWLSFFPPRAYLRLVRRELARDG